MKEWVIAHADKVVCGGTAQKMAAIPALSVPAVLCPRDLCGRLDGLDDHLAAIVVSHAV
jgi:hypothetical protein